MAIHKCQAMKCSRVVSVNKPMCAGCWAKVPPNLKGEVAVKRRALNRSLYEMEAIRPAADYLRGAVVECVRSVA